MGNNNDIYKFDDKNIKIIANEVFEKYYDMLMQVFNTIVNVHVYLMIAVTAAI